MSRRLIADLEREVHDIGAQLIELGMIDDQNFPTRRARGQGIVVLEADYWRDAPRMAETLEYAELSARAAGARPFDFRMLVRTGAVAV